MRRFFAVLTGVAVTAFMSLSLAGAANAADETATVDLTMTPQSGKLSTTQQKPVNWRTDIEIKAPATSPKVQPMKRVTVDFPSDMSFNPKSNTPVCPDSEIGPTTNLSFPPDTVIARCPDSVLGNGTAGLYLAGNNSPSGPTLKDPVLIVFNGGTNSKGQAVLKIYGYSGGTGAGIFMSGALVNGQLDIQIPVLTFDSGTGDFNLNIPGSNASEANRRGVDTSYVQAKCSTGTWLTSAKFTLGTRNTAGAPTSPDDIVNAPESSGPCTGVKTKSSGGKFGGLKIKGPGKTKKGKKTTYKVKVKNAGKSTIKNVKVVASGKGVKGSKKAKVGTLKKGKSKTVKLKLKLTKKGKNKIKVKATGKGAKAKKATKVVKVN